jgi:hypothetical protein
MHRGRLTGTLLVPSAKQDDSVPFPSQALIFKAQQPAFVITFPLAAEFAYEFHLDLLRRGGVQKKFRARGVKKSVIAGGLLSGEKGAGARS